MASQKQKKTPPKGIPSVIAEVCADMILHNARMKRFGVILRDLYPIDYFRLLDTLATKRRAEKLSLQIAIIDDKHSAAINKFIAGSKEFAGWVATREEEAVSWRNQHLRTIAVIASQPLFRASSLKDLAVLDERDAMASLIEALADKATTNYFKNFWKSLSHSAGPEDVRLSHVVELQLELDKLQSEQDRMFALKDLMPILGLMRDDDLGNYCNSVVDAARRLAANGRLLDLARGAEPADFDKLSRFIGSLPQESRLLARATQRTLRKISKTQPSDELKVLLGQLNFADAQTIWWKKNPDKPKPQDGPNIESRPIQAVSVKAILEEDADTLDNLFNIAQQLAAQALDEPSANPNRESDNEVGGCRPVVTANGELLQLCIAGSTEEAWGFTVSVEELSDSKLLLTEEWGERSPRQFWSEAEAGGLLRKFVESEALPAGLIAIAEELAGTRKELLPYLRELLVAPLVTLAAVPKLLSSAKSYIETYEKLLNRVANLASDARKASGPKAESLFSNLLMLETYLFRCGDELAAVLSPLHPLYLWRWITAVEELRDRKSEFESVDLTNLEDTLSSTLHYLTSLHVPRTINKGTGLNLGLSGQLGTLPIYRKDSRTSGIDDGMKAIARICNSLCKMHPYARMGLRVVLVDPPRPASFIQALVALVDVAEQPDDTTLVGLDLRIRYTSPDTLPWADEVVQVDELTSELIALGMAKGTINIDVSDQQQTLEAIGHELKENQAHLLVAFDPFEIQPGMFQRDGTFSLNPWVLSYKYEYDRIEQKVHQVPVADANVFGSFLNLASVIEPNLKNQIVSHSADLESFERKITDWSSSATWVAIADRHGVQLTNANLPGLFTVDVRRDRARTVTLLANTLDPFKNTLRRELKKTFFDANEDTLKEILHDLVMLEPEGILGLGSSSKEGDKLVKAAIGKIVVVRSYRQRHPSCLAVSLDTPEARQWLVAGADSREQADLVGLRESDNGNLVLDVIEVKTHDAAAPVSIKSGIISGPPVSQVLSTGRAIATIFGLNESQSALVRPRREVLRDHLYQACLKDPDFGHKERWHGLLNDLFDGKLNLQIQHQIVRVRLANVEKSKDRLAKSAEGIPIVYKTISAQDVGLHLKSNQRRGPLEQEPADSSDIESKNLPILEASEVSSQLSPERIVFQFKQSLGLTPEQEVARRPTPEEEEVGVVPAVSEVSNTVESNPVSAGDSLDVALGVTKGTEKPVIWTPSKQSNGFFLILGSSGSGKTETLKLVTKEIDDYGIPCLILDFHGDIDLPGIPQFILSSGPTSPVGINPMELDSLDPADGGLYTQVNILLDGLKKCIPSLGHRQFRVIKDAINDSYSRAGITDEDPESWQKKPPTFRTVLNILESYLLDDERGTGQRNVIEGAIDAVSKVFENPIFSKPHLLSAHELTNSSARVVLRNLDDSVRFIAADTILRKLARTLKSKGNIPVRPQGDREVFRIFVVIDEAKILTMGGKDRDDANAILNVLATEYRKFGLGMILASQMSEHFSNELRAQIATRLVLKPLDVQQAKRNALDVYREPDELTKLAGKGDGYLRMGSKQDSIRVQVVLKARVPTP